MQCLKPSQAAAHQAISRLIAAYPLFSVGIVEREKWPALVDKFAERYEVDISPSARQWRKQRGQCSTHLIGAALPPNAAGRELVRFALLVTEQGVGEVKVREKLANAHAVRLQWGDYELLRMTRPSQWGGGSRWTWQMSREIERQEANYLTALAQSCAMAGDSTRLNAAVAPFLRRPMHSGVRTQAAKILRRCQVIWDRHARGKPWPCVNPSGLPVMTFSSTKS